MRKFLAVPAVALMFGATACGQVTSTTPTASVDARTQRDADQLTMQAEKCFKGPRSLSKAGREKWMDCFLTPDRKVAGRACLQKQTQEQGIPFSRKRVKVFMQEVAHCIAETK